MDLRTATYTSFYVHEPFSTSNLGASSTPDFVSYQLLRAWKGRDSSFPFLDAHATTYNVRDDSDWEKTLKPRLHERLRRSKNMILILSSHTQRSRALEEELNYGVDVLRLPIIVAYPEISEPVFLSYIKPETEALLDKNEWIYDYIIKVPRCHIGLSKHYVSQALSQPFLTVQNNSKPRMMAILPERKEK